MSPYVHGKKRALITSGAGQDGWYLVEQLMSRGYDVAAHSRHHVEPGVHGGRAIWHIGDLADDVFLGELLTTCAPGEIYNLTAVSRPALSWDHPIGTARLNALAQQRMCEFIRRNVPTCRLFQASSSEILRNSARRHSGAPGSIGPNLLSSIREKPSKFTDHNMSVDVRCERT